ncbi:lytic transglycosylase domain-containing protein [Pseudothermotoga thermarum]|uniref:Lytic transglycosylase catalytic n=1 Tax=Pseudothermotoga thermarum DSM 5069 TaxID=688269 RepID=F7YU47_9THEM|nr:lytic transglycosylase domain-containing protein [Pseudothermotoga thermarum]AEH50143.1 Lytic transglycosylase catalytic [Pseudothermotoga thermarum DSM 5069]
MRFFVITFVLFACLCVAGPLFYLTSSTPHFTIELYKDGIKLSMSQPFFYNTLPVDVLLPKEGKTVLKGLLSVESNFFIHALSNVGAMGIAQIMSETAKELGVRNAFNVFEAIRGADLYLNKLTDQFSDTKVALAAYYEGPTKVKRYGPSSSGLRYAEKVLSEAERLALKPVFLRDIFYVEPYVKVGDGLSAGLNSGFSFFGIVDVAAQIGYEEGFVHRLMIYPRLTHNFALIFGEENLDFLIGASFEHPKRFGVEFYLTQGSFSLSWYLKLWEFFVKFGYNHRHGLWLGILK